VAGRSFNRFGWSPWNFGLRTSQAERESNV